MKFINKIKEIIKHPKYFLIYIDKKRICRLSDREYIEILYQKNFNKKIDLDNAQTFNEKLQWLKLNDRKEKYTKMVDKYEVKKYVSEKIGQEYIIPTLGIYEKFEDIDFNKLPNQFVMKCTHDSGSTIICKDKNTFNKEKAKKQINKALKHNYYHAGREWPYKNVKPRIIIEQYMTDDENDDLIDYKIMCFNGKVKCSFLCLNRRNENGLNVDFYDREWNKMPFERHYKNSQIITKRPKNYELMIEFAEKLSEKIPFLRVDFYEIKGKLYFGELTFYPGGGFEEFTPEIWDKTLGDWIDLSDVKIDKNEG